MGTSDQYLVVNTHDHGRDRNIGPQTDPRLLGFRVVLVDDARQRALAAWLALDPHGMPLPALLSRPGDDIWTTQGISPRNWPSG